MAYRKTSIRLSSKDRAIIQKLIDNFYVEEFHKWHLKCVLNKTDNKNLQTASVEVANDIVRRYEHLI